MTLLVEKGTFTKTSSLSVPVSQEINLTGAFQPKALILWASFRSSQNTFSDNYQFSFGYSDGTNHACQSITVNETAETESVVVRNNAIISTYDPSTANTVSLATVSSFDSDGFTLSWTTQSTTFTTVIHYIAIGGTDITNASVFTATVPDALTGNHSYNGSGTTFTPDFALVMSGGAAVTTINTEQDSLDRAFFCLGAATSASKEWVVWGRDETSAAADCDTYLNPNATIAGCSTSTGAISMLGDFISMNNAAGGGITINTSAAGASGTFLSCLLIKGGVWDVGTFQQRSGTGTQDVTLTAGLDPSLVFLAGIGSATSATVVANNYLGFGASDGTREGCSWIGNTDALGVWVSAMVESNTKVYRQATPAATGSSSTIVAECDMTDMATPGQFTLDWTTADTTLRQMAFFAVGASAAAATVNQSIFVQWEEAT